MDLFNHKKLQQLQHELDAIKNKYQPIADVESRVLELNDQYNQLYTITSNLSSEILRQQEILSELYVESESVQFEIDAQHLGFYEPIYNLQTSEEYKSRLDRCRQEQKIAIAKRQALNEPETLVVDNSESKGRKLHKGMYDLALTAFNLQCDALIGKVTGLNINKIQDRIYKIAADINKHMGCIGFGIDDFYLELKIAELFISFEYALKIEQEKEDLKIKKEILREQNLLEQEIERENKRLERELKQYQDELRKYPDDKDIQDNIIYVMGKIKENDYRLANQRAGFVYVISNDAIPNAVKIGLTRRLEPMVRVDELSNASVPYKFKVHCIIFTEDCFALESALHREFDSDRVNMVNKKKEFFYISLDQIEEVIKSKYDPDAVFYKDVVCEDFILSEEKRKNSLETLDKR